MTVLLQIATWARTLPTWQSDAVRRLLEQESFSAEDEGELYDTLKSEHGLLDASKNPPEPKPVVDSFRPPEGPSKNVALKSLHSLKHVNALTTGHSLTFEPLGVTAIYGHNGAGKSGYSRVLKRACHAREKQETILPNVLSMKHGTPEAVFEIEVDGNVTSFSWVHGKASSEHLAQVAVFDSHCARVFLDDANEVVYLPYGLDIFGKLGALCRSFKDRLQTEINVLAPPPLVIREFSPTSEIGALLASLRHNSSFEPLEKLANLNAIELERLTQLENLVADARTNSPKAKAERFRRSKRRIDTLRMAIAAIQEGLSDEKTEELRQAANEKRIAEKAMKLASQQTFSDELLPGVGSDPWRTMYEAAMRYSVDVAYLRAEYPSPGDRCVLCQQILSDEASQRFEKFKEFVSRDIAERTLSTSLAFQSRLTEINTINLTPHQDDSELMEELRERSSDIAQLVEEYLAAAQIRLTALRDAAEVDNWDNIPQLKPTPGAQLLQIVSEIELDAVQYDGMAEPAEQEKREAELVTLKARKKLSENLDQLKRYHKRLNTEYCLRKCIDQTATNTITKTASKIMEDAVTGVLETALSEELDFFNLKGLPLKLKKSGDYGTTRHKLQIQNCTAKADLSEILSEGEQRMVALASFLGEIRTHGHNGPIVFDDPVSSLDHVYRERVADRLVREGKVRQVIIFTHDIVMLLAIERAAASEQVKLHVQTVRRDADGPGACISSIPWVGMSVKDRLKYLRDRVNEARAKHKAGDVGYDLMAANCYGLLRETWERAIEEVLLNDAIQRFRPSIETMRLKQVAIEPGDYVAIDNAMAKCSTHMVGHDSSRAINSSMPSPTEIDTDIKVLTDFQRLIEGRRDAARKLANSMLSPPASSAG